MEAVISSEELYHLSIYMIEWYVTSLRYHHSRDDHLSYAVGVRHIPTRSIHHSRYISILGRVSKWDIQLHQTIAYVKIAAS